MPGYGTLPNVNNSHRTIPKDHTSEYVLNTWSLIDSRASHLNGSRSYRLKWIRKFSQKNSNEWQQFKFKSYLSFFPIIICFVHRSCQTKVTNLHHIVIAEQNISCRKIAMKNFAWCQVIHTACHLEWPTQKVSRCNCAAWSFVVTLIVWTPSRLWSVCQRRIIFT